MSTNEFQYNSRNKFWWIGLLLLWSVKFHPVFLQLACFHCKIIECHNHSYSEYTSTRILRLIWISKQNPVVNCCYITYRVCCHLINQAPPPVPPPLPPISGSSPSLKLTNGTAGPSAQRTISQIKVSVTLCVKTNQAARVYNGTCELYLDLKLL